MKKILSFLAIGIMMLSTSTIFAQRPVKTSAKQKCGNNLEQVAQRKADNLQKEFNLSNQKTEEAKSVFLKEYESLKALRTEKGANVNAEDMRVKRESIKNQTIEDLGNILTPEQLKKYKTQIKSRSKMTKKNAVKKIKTI
ncbi:MAG: hypothetical protein LKI53_05135 [Bacteroidales bacterium]|jgi:hypothetical protein|nr:hypothetical protein [Bacteroidales bacterium]